MKLEPNMYVRTKDGYIDKILLIEYAEEKRQQYPNHPSKKYWRDKILLLKLGYWRTTQNIIKASYNIIDILEKGDYVNGHEVKSKQSGVKRIDIGECENYVWLYEKDIKSVITHEQMEQMEYKVEE